MNDQFQKLNLPTWLAIPSVTFSQGSEAGALPSDSPGGVTTDPSGQAAAPVSLSASQAKERGLLTSGTYGRIGSILYGHSDLKQSLVSRLTQQLSTAGSTLFKMTWRVKDTPSGQSVSLLRASGHRTSDKDFGSWPTTRASDWKGAGARTFEGAQREFDRGSLDLGVIAFQASWPTPMANEARLGYQRRRGDTSGSQESLSTVAINMLTPDNDPRIQGLQLASWATPQAQQANGTPERFLERKQESMDRGSHSMGLTLSDLNMQVKAYLGLPATGCTAETVSGGQLNPAHSRWLMGYPTEWDDCAPTVTPSSRKSRHK
jgi:hypothetical protein